MPHILVLEREPLIADDMREEVLTLSQDAVVELATTVERAHVLAVRMPKVDLLIVSNRSATFVNAVDYDRLAAKARSVLLIGEAAPDKPAISTGAARTARAPFTSASLRHDLLGINVDGAPLFQQICP